MLLGAFLAGLNHMSWRRFALFNGAGGVSWSVAFGLGAYLLGDQMQRWTRPLGVIGIVLALALAAGP
jgi:membrane protein DedA with SNARE-associated domain